MFRRHATPLRLIAGATAVALLATACSSDSEPDLSGPSIDIGPAVSAISVAGSRTWGGGRALQAEDSVDGTRAVMSTHGVYVATPGQTDAGPIDTFDGELQLAAMALAPDGSSVVVASALPPEIRSYDLRGERQPAIHQFPAGVSVRDVGFLPGTTSVVVHTTSGPMIWREPGTESPTLLSETPTTATTAVAGATIVSPVSDSHQLVVTSGDETRTIDVSLGDDEALLDAHASPDGSLVAVASTAEAPDDFTRSDSIIVMDATTFERRGTIEIGSPTDPNTWAVADGAIAAASGETLSIWSPDGNALNVAQGPSDKPIVRVVAVGDRIVTVHSDGALVGWGGGSWEPTLLDPGGTVLTSAKTAGGSTTLTVVDIHGRITAWDVATGRPISSSSQFAAGESTSVTVDANGDNVAVASTTGHVTVLDRDLIETWSFDAADPGTRVDTVAFSPAAGMLATGLAERVGDLAFDDTVGLWDTGRRTSVASWGGESEDVAGCSFFRSRISFTGDGSVMAFASHDFTVSVVDTGSGEVLATLPPTTSTILDLAFSPDDDLLVVSADDASVHVWRTSDWSEVATYDSTVGGYQGIAILPDSATMVVSDITGALTLVDVMTGSLLMTFVDADFRSSTVALADDGAVLAAPLGGARIGLWSTHTGRQLAVLSGHNGTVNDLAFAPDTSWLASAATDGTMRLWSLDVTT